MNLQDFIKGDFAKTLDREYFDTTGNGNSLGCLRLWTIMRHVTSGLEYIHSLREVHRDLKPQNGMDSEPTADFSTSLYQRQCVENNRFRSHF